MDIDELEHLEPFVNGNSEMNGFDESTVDNGALGELQVVHDSLAELLKHFWMCFPLNSVALEEKVCFIVPEILRHRFFSLSGVFRCQSR